MIPNILNIYVIHPLTNGGHAERNSKEVNDTLLSIGMHARLIVRALRDMGVDLRTVRLHLPQLEWEPLLDLLPYDIALGWCMDKLEGCDVAYRPSVHLAGKAHIGLVATPGVQREHNWCNEMISDGETEHPRMYVFAEADKLAQWVWDRQNDSGGN